MAETEKTIRLSKVKGEFNVSLDRIYEYLEDQGFQVERNPNGKISDEMYKSLQDEFAIDREEKEEAKMVGLSTKTRKETITLQDDSRNKKATEREQDEVLIKDANPTVKPAEKPAPPKEEKPQPVVTPPVAETPEVPEVKPAPEPVAEITPEPEVIQPVAEEKPEVKEPEAKPEPTIGIKIIDKIDLGDTRPRNKGKDQKKNNPPAANTGAPKKGKENVKPTAPKVETPKVEKPQPKPEPVAEVKQDTKPETPVTTEPAKPEEAVLFRRSVEKLEGPKIMGRIELPVKEDKKKPVASSSAAFEAEKKKKRKRINKDGSPAGNNNQGGGGQNRGGGNNQGGGGQNRGPGGGNNNRGPGGGNNQNRGGGNNQNRNQPNQPKAELTEEEIQAQIKETLARLSGQGKSKASKYRRDKRDMVSQRMQDEMDRAELEKSVLKVTEFVTANQLASMMNVPVTKIISTCMTLGLFVSINQRLDAETISILADEMGYKVEFVSVEVQEAIKEEEDTPEQLTGRPPIVTVMGHVDHGKTSLLDYVRKANVIAGEAGGITQHIGAYSVKLDSGKQITFLDTPGHEAFTAMRARGAQVTDVAIIVVAADDSVMPQTVEAINHAQAAGVPIVFAINKIDKPGANPDKIREALAAMNILVEEWGGKYQCQEISAKKGLNIDVLLEKVLLEAEILDLKANPDKRANGTIIESTLDKGRGYTATMLVENGTLRVGDVILAGCYSGRVKAMHNERGGVIDEVGPATPVQILGLNGAPQAGDKFNVMLDEREARDIATRRLQLQREQSIRTTKHITLDEIGRRLAIGDFKELNIIIKGDVDGSIEALADSLLKLSTEKIQVRIVHKGVGAISESDVLLASASNAIIIGFQVRPTVNAKKLAETEQIDIRLYSIIYKAIDEIKAAMVGMLAPEFEEKVVCNIEIREVFRITKVGTIAGCYVLDGKVNRNTKVRIIRDGIVLHEGSLGSLKRFKDDVKEVNAGYECGLNIDKFDNIEVGDLIEGFEMVEIKRKL
ncbi:MAG: translation initiation factor IF-2 [Bacteroidota bacterium]